MFSGFGEGLSALTASLNFDDLQADLDPNLLSPEQRKAAALSQEKTNETLTADETCGGQSRDESEAFQKKNKEIGELRGAESNGDDDWGWDDKKSTSSESFFGFAKTAFSLDSIQADDGPVPRNVESEDPSSDSFLAGIAGKSKVLGGLGDALPGTSDEILTLRQELEEARQNVFMEAEQRSRFQEMVRAYAHTQVGTMCSVCVRARV